MFVEEKSGDGLLPSFSCVFLNLHTGVGERVWVGYWDRNQRWPYSQSMLLRMFFDYFTMHWFILGSVARMLCILMICPVDSVIYAWPYFRRVCIV